MTPVKHKGPSEIPHTQCVSNLEIFGIEPNLHRCGLLWTNLHTKNIHYQRHPPHFLSPIRPWRNIYMLDGEISGFTSLFPISIKGFIGLIVPQERGPLLLFASAVHYVSCKGPYEKFISCLRR